MQGVTLVQYSLSIASALSSANMYRLFLIFVLFVTVQSHWHNHNHDHSWHSNHGNWRHHGHRHGCNHGKNTLDDLVEMFNNIDKKLQEKCAEQTNEVTEMYKTDGYQITAKLSEFEEANIEVKIKHKVIGIIAKKQEQSSEKKFERYLILSDVVNKNEATWVFEEGQLKIDMPYNIQFDQPVVKPCVVQVDQTEITVPKNTQSDIDVRFETNANQ